MTKRTLVPLLFFLPAFCVADAQWTQPTPEELSMTTQPEVPGAPAVYLYREETRDDSQHTIGASIRLKVLTERGKDYATVRLPEMNVPINDEYSVESLSARTIHPDGTVVPFVGKPLQKELERYQFSKRMTVIFTLPDVTVGSIVEYRYQIPDASYRAPEWFIQTDLFARNIHYSWKPTGRSLMIDDGRFQTSRGVAWTSILPEGAVLKEMDKSANLVRDAEVVFALDAHNIPPAPVEEWMPPIRSFTYRVLFYYAVDRNQEEYWKKIGKHWAKEQDAFIGPGRKVKNAVQELIAPNDTDDQKLRKLYAAVMTMENTDFTRQHTAAEDKANKLKKIGSTEDVLERKQGTSDQLTAMLVAMARAAGMQAYVMAVTNRDHSIFFPRYMTTGQLDDTVAIVRVNGKEQFFDPGSRYCPYGMLAWKHTYAGGLRQIDGGAALAESPGAAYNTSKTQRIASLAMDPQGGVAGTVRLVFTGAPALRWRQQALLGDETSLKRDIETATREMLPAGMEVRLASIDKLTNYELPLTVVLNVKGTIGSSTGKRLLVPASLFEVNARPMFPHEKRELPVYFHYEQIVQDAVRINLPADIMVETLPSKSVQKLKTSAAYAFTAEKIPTGIMLRREYLISQIGFTLPEYPELRTFFTEMERKDRELVVLTRGEAGAAGTAHGDLH